MKKTIIAVLLPILILSGCSMAVHVPASSITPPKQDTPLSGIDVAIIVSKKFESKAYQFDSAPIYLYPGFAESLSNLLKAKFRNVYVFREQEFKSEDYPGNLVIIPNWEIERHNLNIELKIQNIITGQFIKMEDTVLIAKRSGLRSFIYITSIFTVIGIPISMHVDKKDITHRVEVAMEKSVSNLTDKLQTLIIKEIQRTEHRSTTVPGSI